VAVVTCKRAVEAMGTRFEILLGGDDEEHLEAVAVAMLEEIKRLDGVLSRFDPRSEIARINREAHCRPVRVDREVFALLERCERARRMTNGYFDVAAAYQINDASPALQLDVETGTISFTQTQTQIDLGGIGKGYALDQGREIARRFNVACGLLHGGTSSVLALETLEGDNGWLVAVRHPHAPEAAPVAVVRMAERALSCSAVRHPGQAQSDIVNPLTGSALDGDAACVVLAANATDAEIFSTALLAMGRARAVDYLANNPALELMVGWIEADADLVWF
jgi:FAD:protein FMN transferase